MNWTRFTVRQGSKSDDGLWFIAPPVTQEMYAKRGVNLYRYNDDPELPYANRFQMVGTFNSHKDARKFAANA